MGEVGDWTMSRTLRNDVKLRKEKGLANDNLHSMCLYEEIMTLRITMFTWHAGLVIGGAAHSKRQDGLIDSMRGQKRTEQSK